MANVFPPLREYFYVPLWICRKRGKCWIWNEGAERVKSGCHPMIPPWGLFFPSVGKYFCPLWGIFLTPIGEYYWPPLGNIFTPLGYTFTPLGYIFTQLGNSSTFLGIGEYCYPQLGNIFTLIGEYFYLPLRNISAPNGEWLKLQSASQSLISRVTLSSRGNLLWNFWEIMDSCLSYPRWERDHI